MHAGTSWDENRSGRQNWSSQSLPPECLWSWLKFNFAGMPAVKFWDCSICRRRMFSYVREVAQVVPAATSKIHRQHMRIRLYINLQTPLTRGIRTFSHCEKFKGGARLWVIMTLIWFFYSWRSSLRWTFGCITCTGRTSILSDLMTPYVALQR